MIRFIYRLANYKIIPIMSKNDQQNFWIGLIKFCYKCANTSSRTSRLLRSTTMQQDVCRFVYFLFFVRPSTRAGTPLIVSTAIGSRTKDTRPGRPEKNENEKFRYISFFISVIHDLCKHFLQIDFIWRGHNDRLFKV